MIYLVGCGADDQGTITIRASGGFFYCGTADRPQACDKTKVRLMVVEGDAGDLEVRVNGGWRGLAGGVLVDIGGAGLTIPIRAKDGAAIDLGRVTTREENTVQARSVAWGPAEERLAYQGVERFRMQVSKEPGGLHLKDFSITGTPFFGPGVRGTSLDGYSGIRFYVLNPNPKFLISATRTPRQTSRCTVSP